MRLEVDPVAEPPDGAGRDARDRRECRPAANRPGAVRARNPIGFAMRRPVTTLMLVVTLVSGGVLGLSKQRGDLVPALNTPKIHSYLDYVGMRTKQMKDYIVGQYESYFHKHEEHHQEHPKIVVTSPKTMDVTITQQFVCQIHSQRHIDLCALDSGYLEGISVKEGQVVRKGDVLFRILPVLYKTKADAELAEARIAQLEYDYTQQLRAGKVVSQNEVQLFEAKRNRAKAKADMANAELSFTKVVAPFDGIVDRQHKQLGSLIHEGEILTTLSDNSMMWVYFNVPEKQYLEYTASSKQDRENQKIELELANHDKFPQPCINITVEGQFNNQTGNIAFRADFPNPDRVLRHGQTGTILIHRTLKNALVIPLRATFELLDKRYVWVVGEDDVAHQSLITIKHELDDILVINSGLNVRDKIVLEGVREVEEGGKVEYGFRKPEEALKNQKFHAE
jgi:membrane fusion protein (multidrug efflux system)